MSNQARLFILVFLAFLPTVGLYTYADRSLTRAELEHHETVLLHLANRAGHEYQRIVIQGPGDTNPLSLSAGETHTTFADDGFQSTR